MASERTGWLIPVGSGLRTYVGHPFETLEYDRKTEEAAAFFAADGMTAVERADLLRRCGCKWLIIGPYERELGASEALLLPGTLKSSYRQGEVAIYTVDDPE